MSCLCALMTPESVPATTTTAAAAAVADMGSSTPPSIMGATPHLPLPTDTTATTTTTNGIHHPEHTSTTPTPPPTRPTILHLGDAIEHNPDIHARLASRFNIIHPDPAELDRDTFIRHLRQRTWGSFDAILRPFWRSGNTMKPWDRELIELLPESMKVMASAGAGFDWVDSQCLAERGIVYCNGAHASTEAVADMALYLIISVFRHMTASSLAARSGSPTRWQNAHDHVPGISHNPRGHTLGIVGLGNIGFAVAVKVTAALGMQILYTDIARKDAEQEREVGATYFATLEEMLPKCHCVLIATPAGPPLLTAETIRLLPRGARVVNIARGSLIDEGALADALDSGHLDAAGLDVQQHEPWVSARLAQMTNVELTSHTGGGSVETNIAFERLSMENCEAVLDGKGALTPVNLQWLKQGPRLVNGGGGHGGGGAVNGDAVNGDGQNHDRSTTGVQAQLNGDAQHALIDAQIDRGHTPKTSTTRTPPAISMSARHHAEYYPTGVT